MPPATRAIVLSLDPDHLDAVSRELLAAGLDAGVERVETPEALEQVLGAQAREVIVAGGAYPGSAPAAALRMARDRAGEALLFVVGGRDDAFRVECLGLGAYTYFFGDDVAGLGEIVREAVQRQRRLQQDPAEALLRLRKAVETSGEVIFMTEPDGMISYVNPEFTRVYGYSAGEVVGRTTPRILKGGTLQSEHYEKFWTRILNRESVRGTFVNKTRDGRLVDIEGSANPILDDRGVIIGFLAIQRDITARRRDEAALQKREEWFRALIENASDVITVLTGAGEFEYVSPSVKRVLGYDAETLVGRRVAEFVHPDEVRDVVAAVQDAQSAPGGYISKELRFKDRAGEWRHLEAVGRRVVDESGATRVIVNARDVTDRKHAEEAQSRSLAEHRALEDQFRQAQKMEAVGRLAGGVAHDFNNLLTAILGYTDLLHDDLRGDAPAQERLQEVRFAAERAAALTRQLLAFSRKQPLHLNVLDLNEVVASTGNMLRRLLGEDVSLVTLLGPDLGRVKADRGQIEQVLMNLAVNARDAMPEGGQLTIGTADRVVEEATYPADRSMRPGPYVTLTVTDTGTGMDAETKSHLFEPFFTTKERGKGTGLGLATVYGIVKQNRGHVWVDSEPGRGSSFRIFLPRTDELPDAYAPERVRPSIPAGREIVLLAEDDDNVRKMARTALNRRGYTVLTASSGEEALRVARDHPGAIDILITDMVMPGMNGVRLVERVTELRPGIKVLYTSGYTDSHVLTEALRLKPGAFLPKPFTPDLLERAVRRCLDGSTPAAS